jgi:uncharacterized membrane protein YozB (DUF420 family)
MEKGKLIIITMVMAVVGVFALIAVFPMILEGAHNVNATTNVSAYYGLSELNLLSPSIIWGLAFILILGGLAWIFRGEIKRKFFGGD